MLRFEHPDYLWLLLGVPILAAGFLFVNIWGKKQLRRFVSDSLFQHLAPEASMAARIVKQVLVLLSLACLILAIANPQVGTRLEEVKREGIDLFVALDVSLSMKAEDIRPSRLEKAKRDVSELLRKLSGDRVGLVVFAGDAFVQFPLTADYAAADLFLSAIDVDAVPVPGTMVGSAIEVALKSFSNDAPTQKAIVIVTDGENTEGDVLGAVEDAKKANVRIYSVGMGTPDGGPIPIYNQQGDRVDYKREQSGSIVLSKLDETMLQQIAATTGGSYRRATSGGNEIDDIFKELASLEKVEFGTKQVTGFETRYEYPLAFALFFLMIEVILSERRGKLFARLKKLLPIATTILVLILLGTGTIIAQTVRSHVNEGNRVYEKGRYGDAEVEYKKALEKDGKSKEAQFNLGNSYYKQQRFEEALREYGNSSTGMKLPEERASGYYNAGNSLYRANKFQEAIEAYKQALRLNPNDEDTRYNLQMAREKLKQQQQQKQDQKQNQKNEQKKQEQQQDQQNQQQQSQQQKQEQAKQDQTQQVQKKNQMPKQEADRILDVLRNKEKEVQKNLHKREAIRVRVEKDW
jgi:Ca-activated chloride channel family protein